MEIRTWDVSGKYKEAFVKEYNHWVLEVSFRQHTLGSFIIFAKRNVERISDLLEEEIIELKKVMKEYETNLFENEVFKPDRFNYLQMGNSLPHLHFHAIPRYSTPRNFANQIWIDTTSGHPPVWTKTEVSTQTVIEIKEIFLSKNT